MHPCHDGSCFPYYLQVTEGVSEFKPTPPENREFCKNSYSVPNTLLVLTNLHLSDPTSVLDLLISVSFIYFCLVGQIQRRCY